MVITTTASGRCAFVLEKIKTAEAIYSHRKAGPIPCSILEVGQFQPVEMGDIQVPSKDQI